MAGVFVQAESLITLHHARQQTSQPFIVGAQHGQAVERHLVHEFQKTVVQLFHGPVVVQVLAVDIGDGGNGRGESQKRPVAFIRFRNEQIAAPQPRMAPQRIYLAPDHHGGIQSALREHIGHHRGRRRLPMGAGDRDAELEPHQLRQHLRTRDDRNLPGFCRDHFGISGGHCGGDHHDLRLPDIGLVMTDRDAPP